MNIQKTDQIELFSNGTDVFLKCFTSMELKAFHQMMEAYPRVLITEFIALKNSLLKIDNDAVLVGTLRPEIEISVSNDEMIATVSLFLTKDDYTRRQVDIPNAIALQLEKEGVSFGIKNSVLSSVLPLKTKVIIAEGLHPIAGVDSQNTYFQLSEKKPHLLNDGGVDFFDIQLIDVVEEGAWLGEKIPATPGQDGTTVKNNVVVAKRGRDLPLKYDSKTVMEKITPEGKIILLAKMVGAVSFKNQKIYIENHLTISGNVDYSTGNVDFDGFVTVQGTVEDCFSVRATRDISILGAEGIGAVEFIESREGSVFLKGGVNGKKTALINARHDIFAKYCNECRMEAGGSIVVGLYIFNSELHADRIVVENDKGKLIGGQAVAKYQVISQSIGNVHETQTDVQVLGFNRIEFKQQYENMRQYFESIVVKVNKEKRQLEIFELNYNKLDAKAVNTFYMMQSEYERLIAQIAELKITLDAMQDVLLTKGDGEIKVLSELHPKSSLKIKDLCKQISTKITGSFYVKDNTLHYSED